MTGESPAPPAPPEGTALSHGAMPYAVLLGSQVAVGSAAILARTGLHAGLSPAALSAWRLSVASAALLALSALRGRTKHPVTRRQAALLVVAGILLGLHFAAWFASLALVSVARSTLLVATVPLWAGLIGRFALKRNLPPLFWQGLGIAGAGLWLFTRGDFGHSTLAGNSLAGDSLAVAGAVAIALYLLIVERLQAVLPSGRIITWTYGAAAFAMWPVAVATSSAGDLISRVPAGWFSILSMALIPQLLGHTGMNWSLRWFPAGVVGAATLLEPVIAALLAWWFFGEVISGVQAVGGVIVLAGVGMTLYRSEA